jgi:hypothetical protein
VIAVKGLQRCDRLPSWRSLSTVIVMTVSSVVLAACGGPTDSGVAHLGSTTTLTSPSSGSTSVPSTSSKLLDFSRCMRHHKVPSYPDPSGSGKIPATTAQQLGVSASQFQIAQSACEHFLPYGSNGPTPAQVQLYRNSLLKYVRCMRVEGITNFPDPDSRGHLDVGPGSPVSVNTPQFQAAFHACQHDLSYYQSP